MSPQGDYEAPLLAAAVVPKRARTVLKIFYFLSPLVT